MRIYGHCKSGIWRWALCAGLVVFAFAARAQQVTVRGGFLSDSLKIGGQTAFYLTARYPSELNLLFPDSTFDFTPFEYEKRKYFPTTTTDGISVDSAIYYLTTFETDRVQYLNLSVFVVQPQDCTVFESPADSVLITQLVASVPDSITLDKLPLKMNTAYQPVRHQFNFWMLMIGLGILLAVAIILWIIFGKKIRAWFVTRTLKRRHLQFLENYNAMVNKLKSGFSPNTTESALSTWKKYMEQLEARPYTKLTSKETLKLLNDERLGHTLHLVDAAIYGHNTAVVDPLECLKAYADTQFSKKLEEVKHG